jgi:hypothetical protein
MKIIKIKNLDGLARFVAMGTLNLDGNDFGWLELEKIRHLHIIDLITTNNSKLEKDSYCKNSKLIRTPTRTNFIKSINLINIILFDRSHAFNRLFAKCLDDRRPIGDQ